jgi:peptidoglycan hydrolase CwlO-like protein
MNQATVCAFLSLSVLMTGACVKKSAYDDVIADLQATRAEIDSAKSRSQILTQQARDLEELNGDMEKKLSEVSAELAHTKQTIETEMAARQERLSKLQRMVGQLTAQQNNLRGALDLAQAERPSLQSAADMYKRKLDAGEDLRVLSFPSDKPQVPEQTGSMPGSNQPAQVNSSSPQAAAAPAPPPTPPAEQPKPRAPTAQNPEPVDEGWMSAVTGWLKSVWKSIFS